MGVAELGTNGIRSGIDLLGYLGRTEWRHFHRAPENCHSYSDPEKARVDGPARDEPLPKPRSREL